MLKAVIDTNVLVSALLSPSGKPAKVLDNVLNGSVVMCYDSRMIAECQAVLLRPKFGFAKKLVQQVLSFIIYSGLSIVPISIEAVFTDEDDKKFYEVAKTAEAYLVTGNVKRFPEEPRVMTPQEFLCVVMGNR
ncbi:MAG TPA: putative toxin-antitoxin system toxin component, PIN family [Clostridia bacterium]|jgi:putative PIN family toxin of toxin-antitoxin system|nr:putative toxin-antitoxin system toxin component, PIN family [Clostridia bacterium]HHY06093.1 putative toxin-antitoxin system toxin component, PIN family [Clostridia bacterium]